MESVDKTREKELRKKLAKLSDQEILIEMAVSLDKIEFALSGKIPAALTNYITPELKKIASSLQALK